MAEQLPPPQGLAGPASSWAHDWHPYDSYLNIHRSYLERFLADGTVVQDRLEFVESIEGRSVVAVNLRGVVVCPDGLLIRVDKWLDTRRNRRRQLEVRGAAYIYHAWLRGGHSLLRYCSAHGLDDLHRHDYDLQSGGHLGRRDVPIAELPTLADFILHARQVATLARAASEAPS